ncbi:MAG: DegV family protein [Faecousia sp.]
MYKIKISTDSTADIPKSLCEKWNISVLPLTILAEGREYRDGVDMTPQAFYEILDTAKTLPTSSQVASQLYTELFEEVWKEGYTDLIHVTINSKGSGTYQAGVLSRDLFFEDHPEAREQLRIHLMDSQTYSMAYGIPVVEGAEMIQAGASVEQVMDHIRQWVEHARPLFVPLNLKCVKKSGRISPAAAFVGDAMGLKPLITFEDGEAKILSKVRGENKAVAALVDTCVKERLPGSNYALVYGSNLDALAQLREACAQVMDQPPMVEYPVGCVIGINTGPQMIGIIYRR